MPNNEQMAASLAKSVLSAKNAGVDPVDMVVANLAFNQQYPEFYDDVKDAQYERYAKSKFAEVQSPAAESAG